MGAKKILITILKKKVIVSALIVIFVMGMDLYVSVPVAGSIAQIPLWAFNGAYVNYSYSTTITSNYYTITSYSYEKFEISNININTQTFDVSVTGNNSYGGTSLATFNWPDPFPVLTTAELAQLNEGIVPNSMSLYSKVYPGVSVTVPAGTFVADEIKALGLNMTRWYDASNGLLLKLQQIIQISGSFSSSSSKFSMDLTNTNIPSGSGSLLINFIILIVLIIAVVALIAMLLMRKRRRPQPAYYQGDQQYSP